MANEGKVVDAVLWAIIEAEREADEAGGLLTEEDLTPVCISDDEGVFEV